MSRLILRVRNFLQRIDQTFFGGFPHDALCLAECPSYSPAQNVSESKFSLKDLIGNGLLWAVPKSRRTIEKRLKRRIHPNSPLHVNVNTRLQQCSQCGHSKEVGILCPNCYKKVLQETQAMQDKIEKELGLNPVDKSVVVLYDGEKGEQPDEFYEGKRIVEMEKPRPVWFSKNLMQKTTEPAATTKHIKPSDLG